jgi:hypothetical protein
MWWFAFVIKSAETPVMRYPTVAAVLAAGVRKPMKIAAPTAIASDPTTQTLIAWLVDPTSAPTPLLMVLSAIASRKKTRPVPGQPSGKLEKSLCS